MRTLLVALTPPQRRPVCDLLQQNGHEPCSVDDADAACEALRSGHYPLVIFDTDRLDAPPFCRRVRQLPSGRKSEILAMGSCESADRAKAIVLAGADDYCCHANDPQRVELRLAIAVSRAEQRAAHCGIATASLNRSETKYQTLVESAQEGIGITDRDENLVFVNRALADQLGYSKDELLGMNLSELSVEGEFVTFKEGTTNRLLGKSSRYETTLRTKAGQRRWFLVSATPLPAEDGTFSETLGLVTDITDRRRADEAMKQSEARLRNLLTTMPELVAIVNADMMVEYLNKTRSGAPVD
ncbi:MAG TPA: PAS domain S-box protein, partial [Thermoguttaceae bacterium]|nr:PAS domain S-box protein [Thermoguttaceae bacterium]